MIDDDDADIELINSHRNRDHISTVIAINLWLYLLSIEITIEFHFA